MATKGTVSGVIANMVTLVVDGPVAQNEICYISTGGDKLMAEVIKVVGSHVYVQVVIDVFSKPFVPIGNLQQSSESGVVAGCRI